MKYDKNKLEATLTKLIGKSFEKVCYFAIHEGYESFNDIEDILNIPLLGMSIICSDDLQINLIPTDYFPYFGLGGVNLQTSVPANDSRPNHIEEEKWKVYREKKITDFTIIENIYLIQNQKIIVPTGVNLQFESSRSLNIFNVGVESYDSAAGLYELVKGSEELTLFFNDTIIKEYDILQLTKIKL